MYTVLCVFFFFFSSRRRHTRLQGEWSSDVCSSDLLPLTGSVGWGHIDVEGYAPPPGQELQVDLRVASTDYFRALEIPLLKGRFFSEHDTADMPQVVVIEEKFAQRFWPRGDAIGRHLW